MTGNRPDECPFPQAAAPLGFTVKAPETTIWRYLPNLLSALRIASIPLVIWLSLKQYSLLAFGVFAVAALTDFLDGLLARRYGWDSYSGALLDAIADKLFILCLIPLVWHYDAILHLFAVLLIVHYLLQLSIFPVLMGWLKRSFRIVPRGVTQLAVGIAFTALGLGLLQQVAIEWLPEVSVLAKLLDKAIDAVGILGCGLEIWLLRVFLPRYWKILRGRHDTFE